MHDYSEVKRMFYALIFDLYGLLKAFTPLRNFIYDRGTVSHPIIFFVWYNPFVSINISINRFTLFGHFTINPKIIDINEINQ